MSDKWNNYKVEPSKVFGLEVPVFTPSIHREYRGEIFTTFHTEEHPIVEYINNDVKDLSIHGRFSRSYQGVLRGLHYDTKTWKLVQAVVGEIYLVVLNMKEGSSTYGDWESFILSERTRNQVLIPPGFANGHYALTDCLFHYNLLYDGNFVDVDEQKVVKWDDPEFQMEWPTNNPILQKRDR